MTASMVSSPASEASAPPLERARLVDRTVLLASVCTATALTGLATIKGPGMSPDSVVYMASGVNLADGHGLVNIADKPLTLFPPAMSVVAATGERLGLGVYATLWVFSIASFGVIVALGHFLCRRTIVDRRVALGATVLLAVSQPLFGVSTMAWSEPSFIVVTLLFLLVLGQTCARRELSLVNAVVLSVLCWIAFLLRYAGGALIITGVLALLVGLTPRNRAALVRVAAFALLAGAIPFAWMLRNHSTDGTFLGPRTPSPDNLWDVLVRTFGVFGGWLVPADSWSINALAMVGLLTALVVGVALVQSRSRRTDRTLTASGAQLWCCMLFVGVYVVYLSYASLTTAFTPTDSRYLSPVYVPLVVIVGVAACRLLSRSTGRIARMSIAVVLVVLVGAQLVSTARDTRDDARTGIGLNADVVVESQLAAATAQLVSSSPTPVVLYSNNPNALWSATRLQPIHFAPRDIGVRGRPVGGELDQFARQVQCTAAPIYLVLYLFSDGRYIDLKDIRTVAGVERVAGNADGSVFRIEPRDRGDCPGEAASTVRRH